MRQREMMGCSVWLNSLSNGVCPCISDPTMGPSLRRRQSVSGSSVSGCRPSSSRRAVPGRTAKSRDPTDDCGMNCWIESSLILCGRFRYWWNAGGRRITGFDLTVPWAIIRLHRKPSHRVVRESQQPGASQLQTQRCHGRDRDQHSGQPVVVRRAA